MSEQIREQVSAFLDGELPAAETELLVKRMLRDPQLRHSFGRYALIGEALRGTVAVPLTRDFVAGINAVIDGEPAVNVVAAAAPPRAARRTPRWWRPVAGSLVAAGVAAVAVVGLQQRTANAPGLAAVTAPVSVGPVAVVPVAAPAPSRAPVAARLARTGEAISYTVPQVRSVAPAFASGSPSPDARLTNYVFAHSQYSSLLGQRDVLTDLIVDVDQPAAAASNVQ